MARWESLLLVICLSMAGGPARAADKLVLDLDLEDGLISLAHNIDNFLFKPTMNFAEHIAGNRSNAIHIDNLRNHLVATGLVKLNGEVVGIATEQEVVLYDEAAGRPVAESAWLITLNHPSFNGVIAVKQRENAEPVFGLVTDVMQHPDKTWEDKIQSFLSTDGMARVSTAWGGLAAYQGGRFEEYNLVNPADFKRLGRFRAGIRFIIYPPE